MRVASQVVRTGDWSPSDDAPSPQRNAPDLRGRPVLVIGGAGYLGSIMAGELLRHGARVRVLDSLLYQNGFSLRHLLEESNFSFVKGDLRDPAALNAALADVTDVILLASLVGDPICKRYPKLAVAFNLEGSKALFDRLEDSSAERFIFASTCSNYGIHEGDVPAGEDATLNPQSLYAETKIAVEHHILEHASRVRFSPTILRLATAFGLSPRMRFDLTVSQFVWTLASGRPLEVYDADTWRPYCHVRDISKAFLSVLCSDKEAVRGEVYNVGDNDQQFTKRMIVEEIGKHLDRIDVTYQSGDTDPRNYRVNFEKIANVFDFRSDYSVQHYVPCLIRACLDGAFSQSEVEKCGNYAIAGA